MSSRQPGLSTRRWVWVAGWLIAIWAVVLLARAGACRGLVDLVGALAAQFVTNL